MGTFETAKAFILSEYKNIKPSGGSGTSGEIIRYEIMPRDYLSFCDNEFQKANLTVEAEINIISNLKRALDCQINIFFSYLNVKEIIRKKNLGLNKKIDFLYQIGLFPKQSVLRIEDIRNRIEHDFKRPNVEELAVYYDLINAFVIVIEKQIALTQVFSDIEQVLGEDYPGISYGSLKIGYSFEKKEVYVSWYKKDQIKDEYSVSIIDNYLDFIRAFHLFILIQQNESKINDEYTIKEIKKL